MVSIVARVHEVVETGIKLFHRLSFLLNAAVKSRPFEDNIPSNLEESIELLDDGLILLALSCGNVRGCEGIVGILTHAIQERRDLLLLSLAGKARREAEMFKALLPARAFVWSAKVEG